MIFVRNILQIGNNTISFIFVDIHTKFENEPYLITTYHLTHSYQNKLNLQISNHQFLQST